MKSVNFCDVVNGYIYVLFGFFAHLYIIFSSSIYFSLETELRQHFGVSQETLINYFAILSIVVLLFSLYQKWTWPIKIEEALIVIFIWILLRNVLPRDCVCCQPQKPIIHNQGVVVIDAKSPTLAPTPIVAISTVTTAKEEEAEPPDQCREAAWLSSNVLYSVLCVSVMISSFLMSARNDLVSMLFTVMTIVLVIFTTLMPSACNQLNQRDINTNLLKFTLYSIIWFLNRRMRLSERVLSRHYLQSIQILYSYEDHQQNHLLCGCSHNNNKKKHRNKQKRRYITNECDEIACFIEREEQESLIPKPLFTNLDLLYHTVIERHNPTGTSRLYRQDRVEQVKARNFACQIRNLQKIHDIHHRFSQFFSWKHRLYDSEMQNIFDLSKTLWILNVCPAFLLFVLFEYALLNYSIHWNIKELKCLIRRVKVMRHIQSCCA